MRFKKIILFLFFFLFFFVINIPVGISALDCSLLKKLDDPSLKSNTLFWNEYSVLASKNQLNNRTLNELLTKHHNEVSNEPPAIISMPRTAPLRIVTSKRADKELKGLTTKAMRQHFEEFVNVMNSRDGLKELYKNPGRWNFKKLKGYSDDSVYSVRLNKGYRIYFNLNKDQLLVREINADHDY